MPRQSTQTPRNVLSQAKVGRRLYLLGCNHRQVTFYSQQTRAVNLIYALIAEQELQEGDAIAIVGAGVAGVTAAGFAAENGYRVDLYEQEESPLTIQQHCQTRWVHPHIYDWPEPGSLNDATGDLPILNWTAGSAASVIAQIRRGWQDLCQQHDRLITFHGQTLIQGQDTTGADKQLSELREQHKAVILAVGFGKEPHQYGLEPYWQDDDLRQRRPDTWLISGFGDGALADLMHVCIRDFKHEELKDMIAPVPIDGDKARQILAAEQNGYEHPTQLHQFYETLRIPAIINYLEDRVDTDQHIVIQGTDKPDSLLYGTTSAIINRVVTSQIQRLYEARHRGAVTDYFEIVNEKWSGTPEPRSGDTYQVTFPEHAPVEGALIVRHGPKSALQLHFPDLWESTERDRATLRSFPQQLDQSRLPILPTNSLIWNLETRAKGQAGWWCLVLHQSDQAPTLAQIIVWALPKLKESLKEWFPQTFSAHAAIEEMEPEAIQRAIQPVVVPISEALQDETNYRAVVRALCRANVVIADVTEFAPAVMVFLGIRAAVRRGVTLVTSANRPKLSDYNQVIPFNLRELSLFDHSKATDEIAEFFAQNIETGMDAYLASPNYQDLPAYAHVRLPKVGWNQPDVLVLCSFSDKREPNFEYLKAELKKISNQEATCRRVIDTPSPQLNSQRIFGFIRHAETCLVDWTDWRPNVFFELGVRLAVHPQGAICVLHERPDAESEHHVQAKTRQTNQLLRNLFQPQIYRLSGSYTELEKAWQQYRSGPHSSLLGGQTFCIVSNVVEAENSFFMPVQDMLFSSVVNVMPPEPGEGNINQLYATANDTLPRRYEESARERLLAAWFYLDNRYKPMDLKDPELQTDLNRKIVDDYIRISNEILNYLKAKDLKSLRQDIYQNQQVLKKRLRRLQE